MLSPSRMVGTNRLVDGVLGVAQVHAGEIVGNRADHVEVERVVLDLVRAPRARSVRMVVVGRQCRMHSVNHFDTRRASPSDGCRSKLAGGELGEERARVSDAPRQGERVRELERRSNLHLEHQRVVGERERFDGLEVGDGGVVDEHVDRAQPSLDRVDEGAPSALSDYCRRILRSSLRVRRAHGEKRWLQCEYESRRSVPGS
jgi:hypothetical protein